MSVNFLRSLILMGCGVLFCAPPRALADDDEVNYDEAKVPTYTLPDPLLLHNGQRVTSADQWRSERRPELYHVLESQMFGRAPAKPRDLHWKVVEQSDRALSDTAIRRQVTIYFSADEQGPRCDLLLYLPKTAPQHAAPVFLAYNFGGNHTATDDPAVPLCTSWMREGNNIENHRATEATRGGAKHNWPIDLILARGYGLALAYYGDVDPDFDDGFQNGVHALYHTQGKPLPQPDEWGSIATWAWGLSCALDYLVSDTQVDHQRVAVVGHSRLGKTALWAGAMDERFALVISNDSGCGGAALNRRRFGEKVKRINTAFPHWFCDNFLQYNDHEDQLPFDQHELIALMAPRPVLVCSAVDDLWADPRGEFLSAKHATPVYQLFGYRGIEQADPPPVNQLVGHRVGYHIRPGKHDMTAVDWGAYLEFAAQNW